MSRSDNSIPSNGNRKDVHRRVGLAAEVFGRYGEDILAVIQFSVDDPSKAHDLFQEFFVSLVRKPVPSHVEDVRGYLYKAVTRDVIDDSRQTRSRRNSAQRYAYTRRHSLVQEDPRDRVIHAEEVERLLRLIESRLPRHQATVLIQRGSRGFNTSETAQKLCLTKRTVSRYLSIAIKKVRQLVPLNGGIDE